MIDRRDLLIGGGCLLAASSAAAMYPRGRMSLVNGTELDEVVPKQFAGWVLRPSDALVVPEDPDSLASRLYSQLVTRLYTRGDGEFVMMLIAYGDTQNDLLQLHRPETCYPAFGFVVSDSREAPIPLGGGASLPGRTLVATSPTRTEHISYWTRIGQELPTNGKEQRMAKLRSQFAGTIPDGVLVRLSTSTPDAATSFALNARFAQDMVQAVRPAIRPALVTTPIARQIAAPATARLLSKDGKEFVNQTS